MSDALPPSTMLCWFCGESNCKIRATGFSLGSMVYSSPISVSSQVFGSYLGPDVPFPPEVRNHALFDVVRLCSRCLSFFSSEIIGISNSYIEEHLQRQNEQISETADLDTWLKKWTDVVYPYGCWLQGFPDINVCKKFCGLELSELYERGFRFTGKVRFGDEEFGAFLDRHASGSSNGSVGFLKHVNEHILLSNSSQIKAVARIRPVVYDVSVFTTVQH